MSPAETVGGNRSRELLPRLLLFVMLLASGQPAWSAEISFPVLSGRVVDEAGLLSPSAEQAIASKLKALEAMKQLQFVVVTLKSLQQYPIEDYGYQLGRYWKIGQQGKDNGILLIVAPSERKVRIEVGYGLEGDITDALAANIIHNVILPEFRRQRYEAGIEKGVDAIFQVLEGEYVQKPRKQQAQYGPAANILIMLIIVSIALFNMFGGGGFFGGRRRLRHGGYYGGFGSGRSGGFSGGFSGGGGSFGGGGASGGW